MADPTTPEQQEVQRRDELRLRLLQAIYQKANGRTDDLIEVDETIASQIGATLDEAKAAAEFLIEKNLLSAPYLGPLRCELTPQGVHEAEEAIRHPNRETDHFSQIVVNNVTNNFGNGNVMGSIQNGGTGNTATVTQTVTNNAKQVIQELRDKVASLPPEQHEEVHSVIDQIEAMVEKGPKALKAIELLITGLVTYFPGAVPWLTSQAQLIAHAFGG